MEEIIQEHIDKLLLFMREEAYKPLTIQELEEAFGIEGSEGFKDFKKARNDGRKGTCYSYS